MRVQGLRERPELNGAVGEVLKYEAEKQRWEVQTIGASGAQVRLREPHLTALSEEELKALIRRGADAAPFRSSSKKSLVYKEMPIIQLKTGVDAGYSLCQVLSQAEQSIVGTAYCFDYPEGCRALAGRQRAGVKVRVLLDYGQHRKPSREPARSYAGAHGVGSRSQAGRR